MGVGRFVCVALPFGLTICSLICILIVMLAGVTNHNLDMFEVNTKNLSISSNSLANLENLITKRFTGLDHLTAAALNNAASGNNITAADLGLADTYKVSLFNYCYQTGTNTTCTKAEFNWAASALNTTAIEKLASTTAGVTVTLPKELTTSLHTFTVVSKWTEVVYIIAFVTCVSELIVGLFGFCSRIGSCCTFLISGISTVAIVAASIMATIQSSIVVGAIDSVAKAYGVHSSIDTSFLATTWLAAAFSIGGGLFWMFSMCCCAADHHKHSNRRSRGGDTEKLIPTGQYQRVGEPADHFHPYAGQQQGVYAPQQQPYGVPSNNKPIRASGAYEPYAHAAI
ncbi:hypothetical protein L207DRAFT_517863 [Hyaloscypha variabilis F]|jgi:hypothetical protein|uniref:Integral membrane protein n=1 Tax=Hyaloscypha variabilis (strain UAMH 11265 / GT02V1 / F) TaxID=1149755 RepID=A0A2J6R5S2_HYAVF|nr:hypothetical protein L207DRAFT_517863 [Hyaloscypha variabilis F]